MAISKARPKIFLLLPVLAAAIVAARAEPPRYRYTEKTFADSPAGDFSVGEDSAVRRIAVEALGEYNGAIVVSEAETGRILTMVNQKLALADGYIPCSTIKLVVGLAALSEGVIAPEEKVWFRGGWFMTMVEGLAISNNVLFHHLGERLGFERLRRYARWLGLGEKAGWEIPGEQIGVFPDEPHRAGVGRMSTFGDGISTTPLQLAALTGAVANGGDLYYLQHPKSAGEAESFQPRLKRRLPIKRWLPEIRAGMREAVRRGTASRARPAKAGLRGKTGTCSLYEARKRTRMGWFASFGEGPDGPLTVVVMLRGGPMFSGPLAAEIAGEIFLGIRRARALSSTD